MPLVPLFTAAEIWVSVVGLNNKRYDINIAIKSGQYIHMDVDQFHLRETIVKYTVKLKDNNNKQT